MLASSASVSFPSYGEVEEYPTGLTVVQQEYRHDIATFQTTVGRADRYRYKSGTPVQLDWGVGRDMASFYGYVHHIEPDSTLRGRSSMTVYCKGASQVFDAGIQLNYRYQSVPAVISELARRYSFDAEVRPHGRVFSSIVGNGDRAWDLMVRYAKEIGYSLYATNTLLHLHPRTELVVSQHSTAPLLQRADGTLQRFQAMDGAALPGMQRRKRIMHGVDHRTGYRFQVEGGVALGVLGRKQYFSTGVEYLNLETSTPEEARWTLQAMAENERYYAKATVSATGVARLRQAQPVYLDGVDTPYIGTWFVEKVTHRMEQQRYTMDLELGRDATHANNPPPAARPVRQLAPRNNPGSRPKAAYPPTRLVGEQWQAAWSAASRSFA